MIQHRKMKHDPEQTHRHRSRLHTFVVVAEAFLRYIFMMAKMIVQVTPERNTERRRDYHSEELIACGSTGRGPMQTLMNQFSSVREDCTETNLQNNSGKAMTQPHG